MSGATSGAVALAVLAVLSAGPGRGAGRRLDRGLVVPPLHTFGRAAAALGAAVIGLVAGLGGPVAMWLVGVPAVTLMAWVVRVIVRGWRQRQDRLRRRAETIEVCDALVAEMQAGAPAPRAIANACAPWPELAPVLATARLGGDVGAAFTRSAHRPGAEGLRLVAASWRVSSESGAGLAGVLDRVALALRSDEDAHAEVRAALGPPRATAKLLATLPVVGVLLGTAMGVQPIAFLLGTGAGRGCLATGVALAVVGLWWVERLADAVEP